MASKHFLSFRVLSYWHVASGRGSAEQADSVVVLDAAGLPVIPGRTVKGLVRDAFELAADVGAVGADRVIELFGSPSGGADPGEDGDEREHSLEEHRFDTVAGQLLFGSASLPEDWQRWAKAHRHKSGAPPAEVLELFQYVASTAIDARGVAQDHTLRTIQVVVPMTLRAPVQGPADGRWVDELRTVLPLLRHMGSRRNRGYGRVEVTLGEGA